MSHQELIAKMRGRIEMARRLAQSTTDERTARILRQLIAEGEKDLKELEAETIEIILKPEAPQA